MPGTFHPDDSGPAFPVADVSKTQCLGMSLRDYFAGQALAILPAWADGEFSRDGTDRIAAHAYMIADAMVEARMYAALVFMERREIIAAARAWLEQQDAKGEASE